ncbi:MAG: ABC-type transport auxiliary lipoprotein family protein [Xanthomonadaceae bacterium]|jgi:cholesterol transport system auxiliary component|nr:ABC-type transport auxiliary lipoprotein family protein [Xanthomonadaceae bacterium]
MRISLSPLRGLLLAALALAVSGCALLGGGGGAKPFTIYSPDVRVQSDPGWPQVHWQLGLAKPTAARMVDSARILVRPQPEELQIYKGASWAQPATDLVESVVLRAFEDSGRIDAVGRMNSGLRADYKLVMELRRFESDYAGQATPTVVVEVNAKLMDNLNQRVVASRTFLNRQPTGNADIGPVVDAFQQALHAMARDIVGWTLSAGQADAQSNSR